VQKRLARDINKTINTSRRKTLILGLKEGIGKKKKYTRSTPLLDRVRRDCLFRNTKVAEKEKASS